MDILFVTGGARSGKSDFAQRLAVRMGGDAVTFLATARASDPEMQARIARHRASRPAAWHTIELTAGAGQCIEQATTPVLLLDCLTLLVSNTVLRLEPEGEEAVHAAVDREISALLRSAAARAGTLIVVTNEVGMGVVPPTGLGRWFRDAAGRANQRVAAEARHAWLLLSGRPLPLTAESAEDAGEALRAYPR